MVQPDREPLEERAEALLLGFLVSFDRKAQGGFFSKTMRRKYTDDEVGLMREKIKANFRALVKYKSRDMLAVADLLEKSPQMPMAQISLEGVTVDKGAAEDFCRFLIGALRELAGAKT